MAKKQKIIYAANIRLPTEKAHGLATVKICEAFEKIGYEVELIAPRLWRRSRENIFEHYGVKNKFKINKIFVIDFLPLKILLKPAFFIQIFSFSAFACLYAFIKYRKNFKNIIFFSHDHIPLYFLSFLNSKIFYDIHHFPENNFLYRRIIKKAVGFSVQTKWKKQALKEKYNIAEEKIAYWPNGTDVEKFRLSIGKAEARATLDLPADKKIILYTGQLFGWKGVDTLIRTVDYLDGNSLIYIVGGCGEDVKKAKDKIPEANSNRVKFIDFQPHDIVPIWMKAADVLVLPNTGKQKVSLYYTSPMKLFEYMASGTPIVASAIISIQEILNSRNALLAEADNPKSFAEKINFALSHPATAGALAKQAQIDVEKYTWEERARRILEKRS